MEEIRRILDNIKNTYFSNLDNDSKYNKVVKLWDKFYEFCDEKNIYLEEVKDLRMMFENECYSIYQEPKYEKLDNSFENIATIFTDPALDEPRIEMAQLIKDNLENHFKVIAENNNGKIARFNQKLTLNLDLCKFNSHEYILVAKRGKSLIQSQDLITSDTALYKYATDFISLYKETNPEFKDLYNNPEVMYE